MPTYISKVVYGNETLIDLTSDTVAADKLLAGYTAHGADGAPISGACAYNANTSGDTVAVGAVLSGTTFHNAAGAPQVGTMPNIGKQESTLVARDSAVAINAGYHDGSGSIGLGSSDKAALISDNIREGVTILGVLGTMSGSEDVKATALTATPYTTEKTYHPTDLGDYNYFSQVKVSAIAYATNSNTGGGITATIGTVAPA